METSTVVVVNADQVVDNIARFQESEATELVFRFSPDATRVDIEQIAAAIADHQGHGYSPASGIQEHLVFETLFGKYPMLVKALGAPVSSHDLPLRDEVADTVVCLWTKLGYEA